MFDKMNVNNDQPQNLEDPAEPKNKPGKLAGILLSRKFWAAVVAVIMSIVVSFAPNVPDISRTLTEVLFIAGAYILGTAVEPGAPAGEKLKYLLRSRKFWAAIAGLAVILIRAFMPNLAVTDDQMTTIIITIAAYIAGTGLKGYVSSQAIGKK